MISNVRLKPNNIDSDCKIPCNRTSQIGGTCICAFCITNVLIQCLFHQYDSWIAKFKFNQISRQNCDMLKEKKLNRGELARTKLNVHFPDKI